MPLVVASDSARRRVALVAAAGLLLTMPGCTGDDDDPPAGVPASPRDVVAETLQRDAAPQHVAVRRVWGSWPGAPRAARTQQLARAAGRAVTRWMHAGFVGADYPTKGRHSFDNAFATFTPGAARDARRQAHLTTNADLGAALVEVVPTQRRVQLRAYAPRGRAVGATATVQLVLLGLRANGGRVELAVTGDLYLTRPEAGRGWLVFGYDLRRSTGAPGTYARAARRDGQHGQQDGQHGQQDGQHGQQSGQHGQGEDR